MKWFKKKTRPLPESNICSNCDTQTVGRYCHECGQDVFAGTEQPIVHLFGQALGNAFSLDAKTPGTLLRLMFRPGILTNEYKAGRINRYVHPVKLFWMSTLVFFALAIFQLSNNSATFTSEDSEINISLKSPSDTVHLSSKNEADYEKFIKVYKKFIDFATKYAPYITFLFIPIFALLLTLFFWRKKYYYISHLIFTIHFHTFIWLFWSVFMVISIFTPNWKYPELLNFFILITPGVYFSIALHRFYKTKTRWQAVWKAILISFFYFVLILFTLMCIGVLIFREELFSKSV